MTYTERNIEVAKILGLEVTKGFSYRSLFNRAAVCSLSHELKFHSDWKWLMEAVISLENQGCSVLIGSDYCQINYISNDAMHSYFENTRAENKINAVFEAIFAFSQFYKTISTNG